MLGFINKEVKKVDFPFVFIFSDNLNPNNDHVNNIIKKKKIKGKSTFLTSLFINPSIYPITHFLQNTIVMNIRLKGFQKVVATL